MNDVVKATDFPCVFV